MGQGQGQGVLDLHALGQLGWGFALVQAEAVKTLAVDPIIPGGIEAAGDVRDDAQPFAGVEADPPGHIADVLSDFLLIHGKVHAEEAHLPSVRVDEAQHGLERGGFARAVAADEAGDLPFLQGEGHVP